MLLALGTAANLLYFVVPVWWTSPWYVATGSACGALMMARLARSGPGNSVWTAIAASQLLAAVSDAVYLVPSSWWGGASTAATIAAAALYLGAYVLLMSGLVRLLVQSRTDADLAAVLDAGMITGVAVLLLITGPTATREHGDTFGLVGALVLPVLDVFLLGLGLHAVSRSSATLAQLLALAGLAALVLGDVAAPLATRDELVYGRSLADAGWLTSKVLLAVAALHPSAVAAVLPRRTETTRTLLTGVVAALAAVPLVLIVEAARSHDPSSWAVAALSAVLVVLFVARLFVADIASRRRAERARERAAADERSRMTRDMHDVLAHTLSTLVLQLDAARVLRRRDPRSPALGEYLDRAWQTARDGVREVRSVIAASDSPTGHGPGDLRRLVGAFAAASSIPCEVRVEGEPYPLAPDVAAVLHRTVQESLTNIIKHAPGVGRVTVRLQGIGDTCELTVEDVADGFPVVRPAVRQVLDGGTGLGLRGLRERAQHLGGSLVVHQGPAGFTVRLRVSRRPLPVREPGPRVEVAR